MLFYLKLGVSYRDLEGVMQKRGVNVDHTTLNYWNVIPQAISYEDVRAYLDEGESNGKWDYEEACLGFL